MSSAMQGGRDVVACYVDHKSNIRIERMKEEYDFSKGERGNFFRILKSDINIAEVMQ